MRAALAATVLVLTGVVTAPAADARPGPPPIVDPIGFADTFDNGRADGWTVTSETTAHGRAKWQVKNGSLRQSANTFAGSGSGAAKPGTSIVAGNPAWRDYDFGVSARSLDDDALGIVFRYVDRNNFYRFSIDRQRGVRQLVAKVGGRYRVLAQNAWRYQTKQLYRLRVRAVGSDLRAFVDGRQVLRARDSSVAHGRFGMFTWGNPARFDRVGAAIGSTSSFTIAVLPDTQNESQSRPAMFRAQTRWLAGQRANRNIVAVLHEGDVVNRLERPQQWRNARGALNYLAGKLPLTVAAGNHDLQLQHRRKPLATHATPFERMVRSLPDYQVDGRYKRGQLRNTYQLLDAGGVHFVIVNLTYGPSNAQLRWAGRIADRYRDRHVILLTHDYLGQDDQVRGPGDKNLPSKSAPGHNDGVGIWRKFVKTHANVQFTFNGHVIQRTRGHDYSLGRLVSPNDAGRAVYQVLTNFQIHRQGAGYLRLVRFDRRHGTVSYSTYSPYLHRSLRGPDAAFTFGNVDLG